MLRRWFLTLTFLFFVFSLSYAAHVDTLGIGAKASSLGGAFTAMADDFSALYYNPAGLAQIKDRELSLGAAFVNANLQAHGHVIDRTGSVPEERRTNVKDNTQLLVYPHWGLVYPLPKTIYGKKVTFAVGGYVPYGLWHKEEHDPDKNVLAYSAYEAYYYRIVHAQPTIAVQLTDRLYFGIGIALGESRAAQKKRLYVPAYIREGAFVFPTLVPLANLHNSKVKVRFKDQFNWSLNMGLLYKLRDNLQIGLTYRGPTKTRFFAHATAYDPSGRRIESINGHMCYDHPEQIAFGVLWKPIPKWSLEADIEWVHWDRNSYMKITYNRYFLERYFRAEYAKLGLPQPVIEGMIAELKKEGVIHKNLYIKRRWRNTIKFHFGTQYEVNDWLTLRAGYFYDPPTVPEKTLEYGFADVTKRLFALGAGFKLFGGKLLVDVAYQYLMTNGKRIVGWNDSENLNHDFGGADNTSYVRGSAQYYAVTLTYKF